MPAWLALLKTGCWEILARHSPRSDRCVRRAMVAPRPMRLSIFSCALCLGIACAARQPARPPVLPPGDDLEHAEAPPPPVIEDAGTSVMPKATDRELAKAWEPPPPPPPKDKPAEPAPEDEESIERNLSAQAEA